VKFNAFLLLVWHHVGNLLFEHVLNLKGLQFAVVVGSQQLKSVPLNFDCVLISLSADIVDPKNVCI